MEDRMAFFTEKGSDSTSTYDHGRTEELLGGVRELLRNKMKIIVQERTTDSGVSREEASNAVIDNSSINKFFIEKADVAAYEQISGINDVSKIFADFKDMIYDLLDQLDAIEDNNSSLDDNTKNTIRTYAKVFDKAEAVFTNRSKKELVQIKELTTVDEIKNSVEQFFRDVIADYIIIPTITPLYETIGKSDVYEMILDEINNFLRKNGVSTKPVNIGESIDPEYMEPSEDSADNYTDDYSKVDTIAEVRRYPYFFNDGSKVVDGCAKVFVRRK